jgi:hypothetical protein
VREVGKLKFEIANRYAREIQELGPEKHTQSSGDQNDDNPMESKSWPEIDVAFTSEERVEVCSGGRQKTYNYHELGFVDRRNGKPNRAWIMLREMSGRGGTIPRPSPGKDKTIIQKRIEEIRKKMKTHFKIDDDPIPFNGNTYQASFKISRKPSYDT